METKFTTSTNIIRDSNRDLNYIPTPNSIRIVDQIINDFKNGIRSFNIIGSYGTGKSSFLWAFEQSLRGEGDFFNINQLISPSIDIINIIGEYQSIIKTFIDYFEIQKGKDTIDNIFLEIFDRYHNLGNKNPLLVIVIDEFGKFLEYTSQHEPERELYFIQQLSEFINNPDHNILLITTVHQNFDAYAFALSSLQKQEWTKVKGRFREITFNEPVEQLLFLASEHLKQSCLKSKTPENFNTSLSIAERSNAFSIDSDYASEIALRLFPLDLISANILTISLQRYGQNERSLFTFLESTDYTGINSFDNKLNPFYNTACVYDYLMYNFYSFINSRYNPDFALWSSIKNSLEAVERLFLKELNNYAKILKTIGLLNITASSGADLGKDFLSRYADVCLGLSNAGDLIDNLESKKIILYRNYSKRYILFEGTDLDISSALIEAGNKVSNVVDIANLLKREYNLLPIIAKSYSYLNGTPRLFEYRISDYPVDEVPLDEVDGFINLIFNENLNESKIRQISKQQKEAIIYGVFNNPIVIKDQLYEIEKTRKVLEENLDDKVASKELNNILIHQKNLLNHYILNNLYSDKSELTWIYNGETQFISSRKEFNKLLSQICLWVYFKAPKFKNELINKHKISNSIHTAKKNYFKALYNNWNKPDLGFESEKFPPEKTIYLTLLKENGIELYSDKINFSAQVSRDSSFAPLWDYSIDFLNSAKLNRRSIADFTLPLSKRPFKLKQGLVELWISSFLFMKRDDYALFGENGYIPYLTDEVLELIVKYPRNFEIKTFEIEGVKLDIFNSYRLFLNQSSKEKIDNLTFIETIKPFLTFYRGLPEYSQNSKRLNKETIAIREAIANSKDPEKTFFEDFPLALGYTSEDLLKSKGNLHSYITKLQESIRELRTSYDNLLLRFEEFIITEFIGEHVEFEEYKLKLQKRYKKLKKHLCLPYQKTFIQRLDSELDDKKAWLSSIAQAIVGKSLESIKDDEEIILYDKFKTMILELDSLTSISKSDLDDENEEILGIELSSFVNGIQKKIVRLPKSKRDEVIKMENSIKQMLSRDKSLNIAAITNILKDLLKR